MASNCGEWTHQLAYISTQDSIQLFVIIYATNPSDLQPNNAKLGDVKATDMYNNMPRIHSGLRNSLRRCDFGVPDIRTWSSFVRLRPAALRIDASSTIERPIRKVITGLPIVSMSEFMGVAVAEGIVDVVVIEERMLLVRVVEVVGDGVVVDMVGRKRERLAAKCFH